MKHDLYFNKKNPLSLLTLLPAIIFPKECEICKKYDIYSIYLAFCRSCLDKIETIDNFCSACGFPLDETGRIADKEKICDGCKRQSEAYPFRFARSASIHKGIARKTLLEFKLGGRKKLGRYLSCVMAEELPNKFPHADYDMMIPVPMHKSTLIERQFNQSEVLARQISEVNSIPLCCDTLMQTSKKPDLTSLSINERWKHIKGAYNIIGKRSIVNKKILLVDDVYTTGATSWECSNVLMNGGASFVDVYTLNRSRRFYNKPSL